VGLQVRREGIQPRLQLGQDEADRVGSRPVTGSGAVIWHFHGKLLRMAPAVLVWRGTPTRVEGPSTTSAESPD
jgi:hypothetical protein